MTVWDAAKNIYFAIADDDAALDALASEAATIASGSDATAGAITSATVNGQSFAMMKGMTGAQRLAVLRLVARFRTNGYPGSSVQVQL